ncbi:acyltransferase [Actinobacillus sp. GY-402]|nr:acyltransferase [Actinobacillus sp. GY-402]
MQLNTGNAMTGWGHEFFPVGPIWTIAMEFQFYLLFPILILLLSKFGIHYILLSILFIMMIRFMVVSLTDKNIYYNMYHSILGRLDQFLIGILLGTFYIRGYFNRVRNTQAGLMMCISFSLLTILLYENRNITSFSTILYFTVEAMLWSVFILGYLSVKIKENIFSSTIGRVFAFGGMLSFSLYLLHLPVGMIVGNLLGFTESNSLTESILNNLIRFPAIILCSILSYYVIEKPFMSLRTKYLED